MNEPLRLLILGAHPDDAEFHSSALAHAYRERGHLVKMVSVTDGAAGHHERQPRELAARRREEAARAAACIGALSEVWQNPDGRLQATLELREQVIREIRTFRPDVLVTHRTNDYHPDHRAVAQAVQDACYLVRVPRIVPEVPALRQDPVVLFMPDDFTRPAPLQPDVVLDAGPSLEKGLEMLACHESQVFEWLPFVNGWPQTNDRASQLETLRAWYCGALRRRADRYRSALERWYGSTRGAAVEFAEVYEVSEYARPLDHELRRKLFDW